MGRGRREGGERGCGGDVGERRRVEREGGSGREREGGEGGRGGEGRGEGREGRGWGGEGEGRDDGHTYCNRYVH